MRDLLDDQVSITSTIDSRPNTEELSEREEQANKTDTIAISNQPLANLKARHPGGTHSPSTGLRGFFSDPIFSFRVYPASQNLVISAPRSTSHSPEP